MKVVVNGKDAELEAGSTLTDLVEEMRGDASGKGLAVALNGEVITRTEWAHSELSDGDLVEVLAATQGG
jgi:sulfur carrier protein